MVGNMKKQIIFAFILVIAILSFSSCNDPVFYAISMDEKILDPRINGSPTNFVEFGTALYVATGRNLFSYSGNSWSAPTRLDNRILQLAAANTLYALCEGSSGMVLQYLDSGTWKNVPSAPSNIQSIHGTDNQLFLGTSTAVFHFNGGSFTNIGNIGSRRLNGAAYNGTTYYLCTTGGIYTTDLSSLSATPFGDGVFFMGITEHSGEVYAIARNTNLYRSTGNFSTSIANFGDRLATGALAVCVIGSNTILLAGRQEHLTASVSSGYTYGYMELNITGGTIGSFHEPGVGTPTTLHSSDNNERYKSTIGKVPVNHIIQTSVAVDANRVLFAVTQRNGVWSYRIRPRNNQWQWNAET